MLISENMRCYLIHLSFPRPKSTCILQGFCADDLKHRRDRLLCTDYTIDFGTQRSTSDISAAMVTSKLIEMRKTVLLTLQPPQDALPE